MNNRVIGKIGPAVTGIAVLSFAVSMIVGIFFDTLFASCFASMFIALGFVLFMASLVTANKNKNFAAAGRTGLIFAGIYVGFIFIVYFAQCTTINLHPELNKEVYQLLITEVRAVCFLITICWATVLWRFPRSLPVLPLTRAKKAEKRLQCF